MSSFTLDEPVQPAIDLLKQLGFAIGITDAMFRERRRRHPD